MPELVLHIGTPKTASSYIQNCLKASSDLLHSRGINFPYHLLPHDYTFYPIFYDSPAERYYAWKLNIPPAELHSHKKHYMDSWQRLFDANQSSKFIISAEGLCLLGIDEIQRLKNFVKPFFRRIKIVVFLRDLFEYHSSITCERIKTGFYLDDHDMVKLNQDECSYGALIHRWSTVFKSSSISVENFSKTSDILEQFFTAIDCPHLLSTVSRQPRVNERLGDCATTILNHLNKHYPLFDGGVPNTNRGLVQNGVPQFLFKIQDDRPFKIHPYLTTDQATTVNRQIHMANVHLGSKPLAFISANIKSKITTIEEIPSSIIANIINNYNRHFESTLISGQ